MISINERLPTPAKADATLTLSLEARQKSRQRVTLDSGEEMALTLPRGACLRDGDLLCAEDGRVIAVRAAAEAVSTVRTDDPTLLTRAAYHLGNRHVALEIGTGSVRYLEDHVLDAMVEALGLRVERERRPFEPETGAYAGHAHEALHEHG
ncbi:MAG: urease accessory protein UreE [Gammaproteobacteria bacterium]